MNRRKRETKPAPAVWRNYALLGMFCVAALALEARLAWLQLVDGDFYTAEGELRQLRTDPIPVHRGLITDRHGEPLAVSTPVDSIYVNPQEILTERDGIFALADALGLDGEELERKITSHKDKEFLWIERQLTPADKARVLELGIPGVAAQVEYQRFYPMHEITCQLIGLTDVDDGGIEGLEKIYDLHLAGKPGLKTVRRDERNRIIADVEEDEPARPGNDLRLSLDLRLQYLAYRELKRAVLDNEAASGSLVILDAVTGEVLAMASQPACNPNDSSQRNDTNSYRIRAISDMIEPGSTIKPLWLAAALASGLTPDTLIDVPAEVEVGSTRLSDNPPLGVASVADILARSSNPGMVTISRRVEPDVVWRTLKGFGLGAATNSILGVAESKGSLDDYRHWNTTRQATLSYGYGVSATALQLARAYAAIASGGLLPPVSFEALDQPPESVRVISPKVATDLMSMLEGVVQGDNGTAKRAAIRHYRIAGKTGTARISARGGYDDDRYRAIFAGIAPASRPRFVAVIVIEDPAGFEYYGGQLAAPVFARVIESALHLYGVPPDAPLEPELLTTNHSEGER